MERALGGGLSDAPLEAAVAFRAALEALARPGRIERLQGALPPAPLSVAAGTLILTLCDSETPVHLAGDHATEDIADWIAFHAGAEVAAPGACRFAVGAWHALQPIDAYPLGTAEYPDRSATLVVEMQDIRAEGVRLTGPGIADAAYLSLPEIGPFRRNSALFPLGLDFFLTAGDRVAGLPRTTQVASCT